MGKICSTRLLKNAKFLQAPLVGYFPAVEPLDGFSSLAPADILGRLDRMDLKEINNGKLVQAVAKARPPRAQATVSTPLFSGTLRFVQTAFNSPGGRFIVPPTDFEVVASYAAAAVAPISSYCSQYGPNSLAVAGSFIPFSADVPSSKYNDSILSGWADQIAKAGALGPGSCLVFLNPRGVVNTDADATQGVLGYHSMSSSGVPYAFVNIMGTGLEIGDSQDYFALALSHEIAEMTVDTKADGSNPEVCDECAGNCSVDYRNYFGADGGWLGGSATPGYSYFIDGIATPATVSQCPAPASGCTYPPPKPT